MKHSQQLILLLVQSIVIAALVFLEFYDETPGMLRWALFAVLCVTTGLLFWIRRYSRTALKHMSGELRRAMNGNLKTRLLARDDYIWNEVIFSVNELLEQLESNRIETSKSQAARRRLLSSISHDIRTPLTSMIGYVDALRDDIAISESERQEYLAILSRKSNGLKELIDGIFTMAKLDADEMPQKMEPLDFAELTRETLIEFLPELKKQGMELQVLIPDKSCLILADRLSVLRITGNLIKNAIHHGKEGNVLGIELVEHDDEYELLIWDRGPGIVEADLGHVFERMYRSDQSRNLDSGSSGLGLAIARALVEKNDGRIWVKSMPWEKTTFGMAFKKLLRNR
ncbi:sensor histidine kinase [Aneurinibacillus uraniidurans]|uniref:sensor histidine kinase n=1 Tax=Aneurinibacillus uraniidurans TaxID=2966586 RepID=UPI00234ACE56|nr:HAMP domain-containing sensor histidine kinase [Aneurinibacillus sp. B1]WCN36390.1 HAMP domain-containing sensor histidine kinase [Aneurinibacillus sp. B1]